MSSDVGIRIVRATKLDHEYEGFRLIRDWFELQIKRTAPHKDAAMEADMRMRSLMKYLRDNHDPGAKF